MGLWRMKQDIIYVKKHLEISYNCLISYLATSLKNFSFKLKYILMPFIFMLNKQKALQLNLKSTILSWEAPIKKYQTKLINICLLLLVFSKGNSTNISPQRNT